MYNLTRSNRVTLLADALISRLAQRTDSPLSAAWTVVAHQEMGQWLARRMADQVGICANQQFQLAASAIWRLLRAVNPGMPAQDSYSRQALVPRTWAAIEQASTQSVGILAPLNRYLDQRDDAARLRFAQHMAGVFDQYMVYRPQWLIDWEEQSAPHWQAYVWQLVAPERPWHWARCWHWLVTADTLRLQGPVPPQVNLFALPVISPSYLDCITRLADLLPVNIFHWTPTMGYLGDVDSPRGRAVPAGDDLIHPLLGSMAQPHREMSDLLTEHPITETELFEASDPQSLLAALQKDLLDEHWAPQPMSFDHTVQVQRCSSPQREAEVCRDMLHHKFDNDASLNSADVLIVCPSLDQYIAAITSAFGPPASLQAALPWRLLGSHAGQDLSAANAMLEIMQVLRHEPLDRRSLDLLRFPAVRRQFGLTAQGHLERLRWLRVGGLFRNEDSGKFSWTAGFDRWVDALVSAPDPGLPGGVPISPNEVHDIGQLAQFMTSLDQWSNSRGGNRPLSDWLAWMAAVAQSLLNTDEADQAALQAQRQPLADMAQACDAAMPFAAFAQLVAGVGSPSAPGQGRAGFITVAAPETVRLLPARVVYALGISDGQFPAALDRSELDLTHRHPPQRGDRIRRADHRLMFLEWLCSAVDQVVISGCSIDQRNGQLLSLSTVCSELASSLHHRTEAAIEVVHPLHPFSRRYGQDRVGYAHYLNVDEPQPVQPLSDATVAVPEYTTLSAAELHQFWQLPPRWFLRHTLGLWLDLPEDLLELEPPLDVNPLAQYQQISELLDDDNASLDRIERSVAYPDGPTGRAHAAALMALARGLLHQRQALAGAQEPQQIAIEAEVDRWQITGTLEHVFAEQRIVVAAGKAKAKRVLALWIDHLLLNLVAGPRTSILLARDKQVTLQSVTDPREHLEVLLQWFERGQASCLPFFPETSRAWNNKSANRAKAFSAARGVFLPARDDAWPEGTNSYVQQAWPEPDAAFAEPFASIAAAVWQPLEGYLD